MDASYVLRTIFEKKLINKLPIAKFNRGGVLITQNLIKIFRCARVLFLSAPFCFQEFSDTACGIHRCAAG